MSGQSASLKEVIRESIGETVKTNPSETPKDKSGETQSGGTPDYVAGVDISDIPEQDRVRLRAKLEEKARLIEKGYQPKFQEVATLKKAKDWLQSQGIPAEEVEQIIQKHIDQKKNPLAITNEKKDAVKTLDTLIENAPYEQKETLKQMRQIILEETNASKLEKKIDELERKVLYFQGKDLQLGKQVVEADLVTLESKFGKDVIAKYRDNVISEWEKYPNSKAKDILKYVVPDEEYEQALLSKKSNVENKLNAISSQGAGVTSSTATIDVRKTSWKDLLTTVVKEKK